MFYFETRYLLEASDMGIWSFKLAVRVLIVNTKQNKIIKKKFRLNKCKEFLLSWIELA
jgi:hypothetical protein